MTRSGQAYSSQRSSSDRGGETGGIGSGIVVAVAGLFIVGCILVIAAVTMYQVVYGERVFVGIKSMGIDLSGDTPSQARTKLQARFDQYASAPLTFRDGTRQWQATPAEIGLRFDSGQAAKDLYSAGRSGNFLERVLDQISSWREGRMLNVAFSVDGQQRDALFTRLTRQIDQPVMDARLVIQPDLKVRIASSQPGRKLDAERLGKLLDQAFATLSTRDIDLPVEEVQPRVVESGTQEARAAAEKMLSAPMTLQHAGRAWTLQPKEIQSMVAFNPKQDSSGNTRLVAELDQTKLAAFAREIAKEIDVKPQNARFSFGGGTLTPIRDSADGRMLEIQATIDAVNSRIATDDRALALPVSVVRPAISKDDGSKLVIREQIETNSTSYAGSIPERKHNVELAASRLNGVVVSPGEIFSFNEQLGPATLEAGFKTAWGIIQRDGNTQTVPAEAGGICQVSTTLFQSVFWAGYQIEERYWHLYWISKYGKPPKGLQGLDSTVDPPFLDFKFKNNTTNPILIESKAVDNNITFSIYGTKPTWQVRVDPPKIEEVVKTITDTVKEEDPNMEAGKTLWVEEAHDGFKSTIVRTVTEGDDRRVLTLVSVYKPARNVVKVGTKPVGRPVEEQKPPTPTPTPTRQNR